MNWWTRFLSLTLSIGVIGLVDRSMAEGVAEERHYFNDLAAPESIEDLLQIETALKSALPKVREATICLELGEEKGSGSNTESDIGATGLGSITGATLPSLSFSCIWILSRSSFSP